MLDADIFIVSDNFINLFHLVKDNNKLIACNEEIKWDLNERYVINSKPILPKRVKAYKFHCSVPTIFNPKYWQDVLNSYNKICFNSFESENGKIIKLTKIYGQKI